MSTRHRAWGWRRRRAHGQPGAIDEHVEAIKAWEAHLRSQLTPSDRLADWVAQTVGHSSVIIAHAIWFALWIVINQGSLGIAAFDPYPYPFLTLTVSLEAIFLALFVLASQNRLSEVADKRAHLDLQIDLLAEREMTAVLKMLCGIASRLDVPTDLSDEQMRDFTTPTDLAAIARKLEDIDGP